MTGPFISTGLSASLSVNDLAASVAWYRDVLGFAVDREYAFEGKLRAVSLSAGSAQLLLGQDDGGKGVDRVKGAGFSLRFTTEQDVDALASGIKARGATLSTEPADMPGQRAFRLRDPDGITLVFSQPR